MKIQLLQKMFSYIFPGVMPHCLDPGTVTGVTVMKFDGRNWEKSMKKEAEKPDSITNWSKE